MDNTIIWIIFIAALIIWSLWERVSGKKENNGSSSAQDVTNIYDEIKKRVENKVSELSDMKENADVSPEYRESENQGPEITCPACGADLEPDATEISQKRLLCPVCRTVVDLDTDQMAGQPEGRPPLTQKPASSENDLESAKEQEAIQQKMDMPASRSSVFKGSIPSEDILEKPSEGRPESSTADERPAVLQKKRKHKHRSGNLESAISSKLRNPGDIRRTYLMMELLLPPVSLRQRDRLFD